MRLINSFLVTALTLLTACQSTPTVTVPQPPVVQVPLGPPPKPRIALVLGGGAARGFAHVGVIRVLEQEKIPIDMVVGTSVGSLIGAIYASDLSSFELEWTAFQLEKDDLFDFGVVNAVVGMGFAKGDKLEAWVKSHIKTANIENLKLPFTAVAADLNWGYKVALDKGSVARAIRASAAIPGVFQPVKHQGKILVDGGVVDNIPISVARAKGADIVIAVDISGNLGNTNITNLLDVSLQATNIMFALNVEQAKKDADVLITPAGIGDIGMLDFSQKKRCMQAGIDTTKQAMPAIRRAIEAWVSARTRPTMPVPAPAR
ncbi:MAG: patatin-like phospholipase family protein [Holophagaceae bacterium]|uniref:Patatin-like phospholipase family protein n=1 Tax=Candidatus Geothrix skivensis TaxID=2954439 RepID=A0A9D7SJC0_9BACT|nr:patatin-like phospholipase family protein [Candidatus Geothrix skivensis]